MTALAFIAAAGFSALLWLISARFRVRLGQRERVVMKWSLTGKPVSWASPRTALSVTPAVGTLSLLLIAALAAAATPVDERGAAIVAIAGIGLLLAIIHAAHMAFAARAAEPGEG